MPDTQTPVQVPVATPTTTNQAIIGPHKFEPKTTAANTTAPAANNQKAPAANNPKAPANSIHKANTQYAGKTVSNNEAPIPLDRHYNNNSPVMSNETDASHPDASYITKGLDYAKTGQNWIRGAIGSNPNDSWTDTIYKGGSEALELLQAHPYIASALGLGAGLLGGNRYIKNRVGNNSTGIVQTFKHGFGYGDNDITSAALKKITKMHRDNQHELTGGNAQGESEDYHNHVQHISEVLGRNALYGQYNDPMHFVKRNAEDVNKYLGTTHGYHPEEVKGGNIHNLAPTYGSGQAKMQHHAVSASLLEHVIGKMGILANKNTFTSEAALNRARTNLRGLLDLHGHYVTGGRLRSDDHFNIDAANRDDLVENILGGGIKGKSLTQALRDRHGLNTSDEVYKVLENPDTVYNRNVTVPYNQFLGGSPDISDKEYAEEIARDANQRKLVQDAYQKKRDDDFQNLQDSIKYSDKSNLLGKSDVPTDPQDPMNPIDSTGSIDSTDPSSQIDAKTDAQDNTIRMDFMKNKASDDFNNQYMRGRPMHDVNDDLETRLLKKDKSTRAKEAYGKNIERRNFDVSKHVGTDRVTAGAPNSDYFRHRRFMPNHEEKGVGENQYPESALGTLPNVNADPETKSDKILYPKKPTKNQDWGVLQEDPFQHKYNEMEDDGILAPSKNAKELIKDSDAAAAARDAMGVTGKIKNMFSAPPNPHTHNFTKEDIVERKRLEKLIKSDNDEYRLNDRQKNHYLQNMQFSNLPADYLNTKDLTMQEKSRQLQGIEKDYQERYQKMSTQAQAQFDTNVNLLQEKYKGLEKAEVEKLAVVTNDIEEAKKQSDLDVAAAKEQSIRETEKANAEMKVLRDKAFNEMSSDKTKNSKEIEDSLQAHKEAMSKKQLEMDLVVKDAEEKRNQVAEYEKLVNQRSEEVNNILKEIEVQKALGMKALQEEKDKLMEGIEERQKTALNKILIRANVTYEDLGRSKTNLVHYRQKYDLSEEEKKQYNIVMGQQTTFKDNTLKEYNVKEKELVDSFNAKILDQKKKYDEFLSQEQQRYEEKINAAIVKHANIQSEHKKLRQQSHDRHKGESLEAEQRYNDVKNQLEESQQKNIALDAKLKSGKS